jgi:hypothetical protein
MKKRRKMKSGKRMKMTAATWTIVAVEKKEAQTILAQRKQVHMEMDIIIMDSKAHMRWEWPLPLHWHKAWVHWKWVVI